MTKDTSITADSARFESGTMENGAYRCRFETGWVPDSLNVTLTKHRFRRDHVRKAWDNLIWHCSLRAKPKVPLERFRVRVERHSSRLLDFDNMVSSFKDVIDAMVTVGILAGDEYKRSGSWSVEQFKCSTKTKRIVVEIVEVIGGESESVRGKLE
jgi:hypothetical protein